MCQTFDAHTPSDLDADGLRAVGKGGLDPFHFGRHIAVGGARQSIGPVRAIDPVIIEGDAGEVSGLLARFSLWLCLTPGRFKGIEQAAPVERFNRRQRQAAHAEGQLFQRRVRAFRLLQHQHGDTCKPELAGQQQADRPGACNHDIEEKRRWVAIIHERLLLVVRPEQFVVLTTTRTNGGRSQRPTFVAGSHAWGRGQSFRFQKDLGLPNQVCLFRHRQHIGMPFGLQRLRDKAEAPFPVEVHACSKPLLMLGKSHGQHRNQHLRDDDAALIAWRVSCVQNAPATALEAVFSWVDPSRGH